MSRYLEEIARLQAASAELSAQFPGTEWYIHHAEWGPRTQLIFDTHSTRVIVWWWDNSWEAIAGTPAGEDEIAGIVGESQGLESATEAVISALEYLESNLNEEAALVRRLVAGERV
jgi:hypothetical protein